jgi:hypothetical protein
MCNVKAINAIDLDALNDGDRTFFSRPEARFSYGL